MKTKTGKVYIVGAGPGDPELISVKGLKALKRADCVLYDFLSSPELLKHVKRGAKKICVGKTDGLHLKEQDEINKLIIEKALIHKTVVRLKGGDPMIFGRASEELKCLTDNKIDFEIIPGITAASAAASAGGVATCAGIGAGCTTTGGGWTAGAGGTTTGGGWTAGAG